jgi:hypothetical protein
MSCRDSSFHITALKSLMFVNVGPVVRGHRRPEECEAVVVMQRIDADRMPPGARSKATGAT